MIELLPYQRTAQQWLQSRPSAILADETGVGKSYPAIFAGKRIVGPKLIVCPKYLITNWHAYLSQCGEGDVVEVVTGTPKRKLEALWRPAQWYIITYEMLGQTSKARYSEYRLALIGRGWRRVIFDEAHRLRNRSATWTQMARKLQTEGYWFLTGSPLYRTPADVFPLLNLINPKLFSSYWKWVNLYCNTYTDPWKTEVTSVKNPTEFQRMLNPHMLRRTHEDVGSEIPERARPITLSVQLSQFTRQTIKGIRDEFKSLDEDGEEKYLAAQAAVSEIRQWVGQDSQKLATLKELVSDLNDRVAVLCWYRKSAQAVAEALNTNHIVTGAFDALKRKAVFDELHAEPKGIVVATIESVKEGLNLQHISKVVFYEQDWLPETNNQVRGRFYRKGQTASVQEYHIQGFNSIDERVAQVAENRNIRIRQALMEELNR